MNSNKWGDEAPSVSNPFTLDIDVNNLDRDVEQNQFNLKKEDSPLIIPELENIKFILKDVLAGDSRALDDPRIQAFNFDKIKYALNWLLNNTIIDPTMKLDLLKNSWRMVFKEKPPTPEDFLTEKYIGDQANTLHWPLKDTFCDFFDTTKPYRTLVLNSSIGFGKSTLTILANLFITTHLALMHKPYKFFGGSASSIYVNSLCAVSQKKASETLFEPFVQVIEQAPFFKRIKTHQEMKAEETKYENQDYVDYIGFSTSSATPQPLYSKIYLPNGNFKLMGDIKIGDIIASPTQKETEVIEITPQGEIECYEIELEDGRKARAGLNHLWKVCWEFENNIPIWKIVTTKFLLDNEDFNFYIYDISDDNTTIIQPN